MFGKRRTDVVVTKQIARACCGTASVLSLRRYVLQECQTFTCPPIVVAGFRSGRGAVHTRELRASTSLGKDTPALMRKRGSSQGLLAFRRAFLQRFANKSVFSISILLREL
eukprot:3287618-Pleurochrysis_carterae.AAC.2